MTRDEVRAPRVSAHDCVDHVGTNVLEGDLELVHVMHCEIEDWFSCGSCAFSWSETQHI